MSDLRHAWAVMGLRPGSSLESLRARYKALVKRWHPDRFESDPAGRTLATQELQRISGAYRALLESKMAGPAGAGRPEREGSPRGRPLTREEIDRMVASIGTTSWIEDVLVEPDTATQRVFRGTYLFTYVFLFATAAARGWLVREVSLLEMGAGTAVCGVLAWRVASFIEQRRERR